MSKIYVLDTNVILHDPRAIRKFEDNDVVIPIYVIEEVDTFKREMSELGRNARQFARFLDDMREKSGGSLQQGVVFNGGGRLRVAVPKDLRHVRTKDNAGMDRAIVETALEIRDQNPDRPVVFITMDSNLRIRADALGLRAENYEGGRILIDDLYSGVSQYDVPGPLVDMLGKREVVELDRIDDDVLARDGASMGGRREGGFDDDGNADGGDGLAPHPNACIILRELEKPNHSALGRYDCSKGAIVPLRAIREGAWGVRPRNVEQSFAMDMLLNPDVHLVTLVGKAGTGKTLLAVAAGLKAVIDDGTFARLLVSRPIFPLGRDVGYLPGTLEEKLNPWMQPIYDNLEYIFSTGKMRAHTGRTYNELLASGTIDVEPLTYIRGRSLPNQYLIVDEAQNLTPHEVKTVITRCGAETKIVLTGDPYQIDNPYVDSASNGLSIVAERFKGERISAHITLAKGERSELAERATEIL